MSLVTAPGDGHRFRRCREWPTPAAKCFRIQGSGPLWTSKARRRASS